MLKFKKMLPADLRGMLLCGWCRSRPMMAWCDDSQQAHHVGFQAVCTCGSRGPVGLGKMVALERWNAMQRGGTR